VKPLPFGKVFIMQLKYFLTICGVISFAIFITAKNGLLISEKISFIFSDDYIFFLSMFFFFMGYYISLLDKKEKTRKK
jgi:hypothetical protein